MKADSALSWPDFTSLPTKSRPWQKSNNFSSNMLRHSSIFSHVSRVPLCAFEQSPIRISPYTFLPSSWPQNDSSLGIWFELLCQRDWVWYSSQLLHGIAIPWRNPSTRERKEKYIIDRCLMQGQRQETQMEDGNVQQILLPKASTMADNKTWCH